MTDDDLLELMSIPFVDKGRDTSGCDCWGLTMLAFRKFGIELPDYKIPCMNSEEIGQAVEASRHQWRPLREPKAPCLVTLKLEPKLPDFVSHLGAYVGDGRFLHTMKSRVSVLERIDHPYFSRKIEGFYEFIG